MTLASQPARGWRDLWSLFPWIVLYYKPHICKGRLEVACHSFLSWVFAVHSDSFAPLPGFDVIQFLCSLPLLLTLFASNSLPSQSCDFRWPKYLKFLFWLILLNLALLLVAGIFTQLFFWWCCKHVTDKITQNSIWCPKGSKTFCRCTLLMSSCTILCSATCHMIQLCM